MARSMKSETAAMRPRGRSLMARKRPVLELPAPSTAMTGSVEVSKRGREVTLGMTFDWEGLETSALLQFSNVRADLHHSEAACAEWHIKRPYDTVCEVERSPWLAQVDTAVRRHTTTGERLKHFMVFIDSEGCFELIASSCTLTELT